MSTSNRAKHRFLSASFSGEILEEVDKLRVFITKIKASALIRGLGIVICWLGI